MVFRLYVEKKKGYDNEARALLSEAKEFLGIKNLESVRLFNRYDVENIDSELFEFAKTNVFSEPQTDNYFEKLQVTKEQIVFAVEYLPGQFDQRADSAAQCLQIISAKERPLVRAGKVYVLTGKLSKEEVLAIKKHVINPVESREASLDKVESLKVKYDMPSTVETVDGFIDLDKNGLIEFVKKYALAMDSDDAKF